MVSLLWYLKLNPLTRTQSLLSMLIEDGLECLGDQRVVICVPLIEDLLCFALELHENDVPIYGFSQMCRVARNFEPIEA